MRTLRIHYASETAGLWIAWVSLDGRVEAGPVRFVFPMTAQDREDLRWYLEDFLQYPLDPAPKAAQRIEERLRQIGTELFQHIFGQAELAHLWTDLRQHLSETRIELVSEGEEDASLPWELLRDPVTNQALALDAAAFVHAPAYAAQTANAVAGAIGPIRILLAICRPWKAIDVPFRSVASRILKGLNEAARRSFQLDVLRPPSFDQLSRRLREASARGQPYHVLHFDGHGVEGHLLFEGAGSGILEHGVSGEALGELLVKTGVTALVLNACRSAHADPPGAPERVGQDVADPRPFGSFAAHVLAAGGYAVVAMRYNVFVQTAAQFIAGFYSSLAKGNTIGEAASEARRKLAEQPMRGIAYDPVPLDDWLAPMVYEAAPIRLFPQSEEAAELSLAGETSSEVDEALPPAPDVGFFGRDETLLALDRAFDHHRVVLLHAYAGGGKTATAVEFARWYSTTGGAPGPPLFTSFEHYKPLERVLDQIGQRFGPSLEQTGVHWLALDEGRRREVAIELLRQTPLLWIWDNVEPIAGFPDGADSDWSVKEQADLGNFLRQASAGEARFLLTSRRQEKRWLGGLTELVLVPPMPFQERAQLARALAERAGHRLADVADWRPLLDYTGGNPLTITVVVRQALRGGVRTKQDVEEWVAELHAGGAGFQDDLSEGRTQSLAASLSYGFEYAFTEPERRQLALLHLFQGFVNLAALRFMGTESSTWRLDEVRGLSQHAGERLLNRAADLGLLTVRKGGFYAIHPALPWFFRRLFETFYAGREIEAKRSFAEVMGSFSNYCHNEYVQGNRRVIGGLIAEEPNLIHAWRMARANGWWHCVLQSMQGLRDLYGHTGRQGEWSRLVGAIVPEFVDPATEGPLPGREEEWSLVTQYRALLARDRRDWQTAERLQRARVNWEMRRTAENADRTALHCLAASLHGLGEIQMEMGRAECLQAFRESFMLTQRIGERAEATVCAFNLAHALITLPDSRDLEEAERWCRRALGLCKSTDALARARCLGQLGAVRFERYREARAANQFDQTTIAHLQDAADLYQRVLTLLPPDAMNDLAVAHTQLGKIYHSATELERSLAHFRLAIRYKETSGNRLGAAETRYSAALAYIDAGRIADARDYALAARREFEEFGGAAEEETGRVSRLLEWIERQ